MELLREVLSKEVTEEHTFSKNWVYVECKGEVNGKDYYVRMFPTDYQECYEVVMQIFEDKDFIHRVTTTSFDFIHNPYNTNPCMTILRDNGDKDNYLIPLLYECYTLLLKRDIMPTPIISETLQFELEFDKLLREEQKELEKIS